MATPIVSQIKGHDREPDIYLVEPYIIVVLECLWLVSVVVVDLAHTRQDGAVCGHHANQLHEPLRRLGRVLQLVMADTGVKV